MVHDYVAIQPLTPKAIRRLGVLMEAEDKRMREVIAGLPDDEAAIKCNDLAEVHSLQRFLEGNAVSEVTTKEFDILLRVLVEGVATIGEKLQRGGSDEDEISDLSNDLGFLSAVLSGLRKSEEV